MRKIAVVRCAFVLTLTMLAGCGSGGVSKTVTNNKLGFAVAVTEFWTVTNFKDTDFCAESNVAGGADDVAIFTVSVHEFNKSSSLDEYVDRQASDAGQPEDYKLIEKIRFKLGDIDAYKVKSTVRFSMFVTYYVVAGKRGYILTSTAYKKDYDKYAKEIDAIVKSFKLIEAK